MNELHYYNREKKAWDEKELCDIKNEYETKELTISQIADIHHRTPESISYKLKKLGIITHNTLARGYLEYKNSSLYKEIIETRTTTDTKKKVKKEAKLKLKTEMPTINPTNDIEELREELSFLKKELKRCYALYGLESPSV